MAKKEKEKDQSFYVINIKLRDKESNNDLTKTDYVRIFERLYKNRVHKKSSATKHCILRNQFIEKIGEEVVYMSGLLAQFTYIENEKWFNLKSLDIDEEFSAPDGLFPDPKMTEYIFIPKAHRFCYKVSSEFQTNPYPIKNYLQSALMEVCNSNEYIQVDVETEQTTIDKILVSPTIKKISIDINYSNFDNGGVLKKFVEDDVRESNMSRLKIEAIRKPGKSIEVNKSKILSGAISSAISNGEAIANVVDVNGKNKIIKTTDFPLKEFVRGFPSRFNALVHDKIMNLFRNDN